MEVHMGKKEHRRPHTHAQNIGTNTTDPLTVFLQLVNPGLDNMGQMGMFSLEVTPSHNHCLEGWDGKSK
jgi:hypothetical protein